MEYHVGVVPTRPTYYVVELTEGEVTDRLELDTPAHVRSPMAYHASTIDWTGLKGHIASGMPGDVDGVIEYHGRLLYLEAKSTWGDLGYYITHPSRPQARVMRVQYGRGDAVLLVAFLGHGHERRLQKAELYWAGFEGLPEAKKTEAMGLTLWSLASPAKTWPELALLIRRWEIGG